MKNYSSLQRRRATQGYVPVRFVSHVELWFEKGPASTMPQTFFSLKMFPLQKHGIDKKHLSRSVLNTSVAAAGKVELRRRVDCT